MNSIQRKAQLLPVLLMVTLAIIIKADFYFFSPLKGKSFHISIETPQQKDISIEMIFEDAPAVLMAYHTISQSFKFSTDSPVRLKEVVVFLKEGNYLNISALRLVIDNNEKLLTGRQVYDLVSQSSNNVHQTKLYSDGAQIVFEENKKPPTVNYVKLSPLKSAFFSYSKLQIIVHAVLGLLLIVISLLHYKKLIPAAYYISSVQLAAISILIFFGTLLYRPNTNNVILVLLPLIAATMYWKNREFKPFTVLAYLFVLFYFIRAAGLIYTDFSGSGITTLETCLPFILFPIVFSIIHFDSKHIIFTFHGIYIVISTLICITMASLLYNIEIYDYSLKIYFSNIKPLSSFLFSWSRHGHPSYLCLAVIIAIIYQFQLLQWKRIAIYQVVFFHVLAVVYIVLSGARIGYILYPLVLSLYCFHFYQIGNNYKYLFGLGVLSLALLVTFFPGILHSIDPARSSNWTAALPVVMKKPFTGYGTDGNLILKTIPDWVAAVQDSHLANVHNQYLNELIQFGIGGLLLLLVILIFLLINSARKNDYPTFTFTVCVIIFMTFENALSRSYGVGLVVLNLCLLNESWETRNQQFGPNKITD